MPFPNSPLFQNATTNARTDSKVKPEIRSQSSYLGMDVVSRLKECATSDPKHILNPDSGPHVAIIHQALEKLAASPLLAVVPNGVPSGPSDKDARQFNDAVKALKANPIDPKERALASYGPSTARAVKAYKTARDIRRTPNSAVDDVVGIQTIQSLDRDISPQKNGELPPINPPVEGKTPIDFVIAFVGGRDDSDFDASLASGSLGLNSVASNYKPLDPKKPNGPGFVHTLTGRRLHCIGRGSRTPDSEFLVVTVMQEMLLVLRDTKLVRGKVFIRGGSAGGRNALLLATRLSQGGVALEMVASIDAAFFAPQADQFPKIGSDLRPSNIPEFSSKLPYNIQAKEKFNFFQTKQNRYRPSFSADGHLDWTSTEDNNEIHGKLTAFGPGNTNLDSSVGDNDGLAHNKAVGIGEQIVAGRIRTALGI